MKLPNKIIASILATLILLSFMPNAAMAAAPVVSVDESVYVNLDHYGKPTNVNIVKGCSLNGNQHFMDYGDYDAVTNMSNNAIPDRKDGSVGWSLDNYTGRFYYECTAKQGTIILPWDIDVSYSLNGDPISAEKLAGASGLVQIDVKITPNTNSNIYYQNNMLLQVQSTFDMSKVSNVDAPGAQLQTIGGKKIVLFAAMPGEEDTFTMRIGTNSFETDGLLITMVPGKLKQLKDAKELKEDIDTFQDSVNSIYESTNVILKTIETMESGMSQAKSGLSLLERANQSLSASKDSLFSKSEKALTDLSEVTANTAIMIPHLKEGENAIQDLNTDINALTKTMESTKTDIEKYKTSISNVQDDLSDLREVLKDVRGNSKQRDALVQTTRSDIRAMKTDLDSLCNRSSDLASKLSTLGSATSTLASVLKSGAASSPTDYSSYFKSPENLILYQTLMGMNESNQAMLNYMGSTLSATAEVSASANDMMNAASKLSENGKDYLNTASKSVDLMESYFEDLDSANVATDKLLGESSEILSTTSSLLTKGESLIDNVSAINTTANKYKDSSIKALQDTENLTSSIVGSLQSAQSFLNAFEETLKNSSDDLTQGNAEMLKGVISTLQQSLIGIKQTPTLKKANDTIKATTDKEINKFKKENRLLYLDQEAPLISFTSNKNPAPQSIQVVLRTQEINKDSNNTENIANADPEEQDSTVLERIARVFIELGQALGSIFSHISP